jgi:phage terminase large subunit-like protein
MSNTLDELLTIDEELLSINQRFQLPQYKEAAYEFLSKLSKAQIENLKYDFRFNARPKQLPPEGDWTFWLIGCGRGFGKTFAGAGWIKEEEARAAKEGKKLEIGIFGDVYQETERTMVAAILAMYPEKSRPIYSSNKKLITWKSGCIAHVIQGGQTPNKLRGLNLNIAWIDEFAKFQYPAQFFDQLMFCLRKGENIKCLITTTPAIATNKLLREIINGDYGTCVRVRGNTDENLSLNKQARNNLHKKYDGTRLGAQELSGDLLDDISGGLWKREMIKDFSAFIREEEQKLTDRGLKLTKDFKDTYLKTQLKHVVVAVDPAITNTAKSDETGIVVVGRNYAGQGFVLDDQSGKYSPNEWASIAVSLHNKYKCKQIVAESNQGGDMVKSMIHNCDPKINVELVRATKGKLVRAEPVAMLYEQGRFYHCAKDSELDILEDQLCNYSGKKKDKVDETMQEENQIKSPDRMDALVWAVTHLFSDMIKSPARGSIPFRFSSF